MISFCVQVFAMRFLGSPEERFRDLVCQYHPRSLCKPNRLKGVEQEEGPLLLICATLDVIACTAFDKYWPAMFQRCFHSATSLPHAFIACTRAHTHDTQTAHARNTYADTTAKPHKHEQKHSHHRRHAHTHTYHTQPHNNTYR